MFFVSYEWLLEKPAVVLSDLLHWLGLQNDNDMVQRAIANMQFGNLQAMERRENKMRTAANEQAFFFRKGCSGEGDLSFSRPLCRKFVSGPPR